MLAQAAAAALFANAAQSAVLAYLAAAALLALAAPPVMLALAALADAPAWCAPAERSAARMHPLCADHRRHPRLRPPSAKRRHTQLLVGVGVVARLRSRPPFTR
eukprot:5000375-Prymnesium_polylepis.1